MRRQDSNALLMAVLVGRRIRELRLDAEMTLAELGRRTGIHRPIMSRIERGTHLIDLRTAAVIARALGIDVATLLVCVDERWIRAGECVREELLNWVA